MFFSKRFFPLFIVQFLGAFNDNVFKNALVILLTFQLAKEPVEIGVLIALAAGIFILPFFLFSATAGKIADSYDKTWLIRKIKLVEVLIMLTGAVAFIMQDLVFLYVVLFFMGLQSAFFGPIKYAILPEHIPAKNLLKANGWFSASTFVAILLGTLIGGFLVLMGGVFWLSLLIIAIALLGYIASLFIPHSIIPPQKLALSINIFATTWAEIKYARQYPQAFFAILAISWFWFLGATYLSQMPVMVKELIFADDKVVHLFLVAFSVGIAIGALLINSLKLKVKSIADLRWLALLLLGISLAIWVSNIAISMVVQGAEPLTFTDFFFTPPPLIILLMLVTIAILGGAYIVPLYTLLQVQSPQGSRARVVAANNIINAILMVASAVLIMGLYSRNWNLVDIFYLVLTLNLFACAWLYQHILIERKK